MTRRGNVLDLAEVKDQERPHRKDHKHDKPDQEIGVGSRFDADSQRGIWVYRGRIQYRKSQRDWAKGRGFAGLPRRLPVTLIKSTRSSDR